MKKVLLILVFISAISLLSSDNFLGKDKVAHFSSSFILTVWSSGCCGEMLKMNRDDKIYLGVGITLGLGLSKEGSDKWIKEKSWGWYDLFWDAAGASAALILINNDVIKIM